MAFSCIQSFMLFCIAVMFLVYFRFKFVFINSVFAVLVKVNRYYKDKFSRRTGVLCT